VVLDEQTTTQGNDEDGDDSDSDDETANIDIGVRETWKFMTDRWKLDVPKLIISVIDEVETIIVNPGLETILSNLAKFAAEKGVQFTPD